MTRLSSILSRLVVAIMLAALVQPVTTLAGDEAAGDDDDVAVEQESEDDPPAEVSNDDGSESNDPVDDGDVDDDEDDLDDDQDDDDEDLAGEDIDIEIPNEAVVHLYPEVDPHAFAARHEVTILDLLPSANILRIELDDLADDQGEIDALATDPEVISVERNFTGQAPEGRPRYFFTSTDGTSSVTDQPALPEGLEFTPANACVTGQGVTVAVLDTGIDATHPDLAGSVLDTGLNTIDATGDVADTGNGVDDDGDGAIDEMTGHGTHVAGTILQVAPGVSIIPVKVLDSDGHGDTYSIAAGMYHAVAQGADVINLSLGSTYDSVSIRDAVAFAVEHDVVVIAAAGNSSREQPVEYPAALDGVISIAATTATADRAGYSNYGPTIDLSIPGNDVASAYPGNQYAFASGTSMAAAIGTGAAALVLEREPGDTASEVSSTLTLASGPLNLTDPAELLGAGELNIDRAIACGG